VEKFNSVCVIGFNSPEWVIANLGAMFCGYASVIIHMILSMLLFIVVCCWTFVVGPELCLLESIPLMALRLVTLWPATAGLM